MSIEDHAGSSKNVEGTISESGTSVTQPVSLSVLRSLRTRHSQPQLITKLIEQTKSYQDGTGNPAMLPKLMARPLRQIQGE
jgi:hypothetical protein